MIFFVQGKGGSVIDRTLMMNIVNDEKLNIEKTILHHKEGVDLIPAIDACENKWLKVAFHLAFAATVRIGELLGLTWDCVDISEEAISENRAYVFINKQVERVSKEAVQELDSKEVILIFPSQRKNNKTVRVLKTPKTDTSERKVYIPGFVAQCLIDIKKGFRMWFFIVCAIQVSHTN